MLTLAWTGVSGALGCFELQTRGFTIQNSQLMADREFFIIEMGSARDFSKGRPYHCIVPLPENRALGGLPNGLEMGEHGVDVNVRGGSEW